MFRNLDPSLHPQERAHEYVRAVNSAKLDKVQFAIRFSLSGAVNPYMITSFKSTLKTMPAGV